MPTSIECLSTEIFFEIFDYLLPFDVFYSFFNITKRFNAIVGNYPLRLDFQRISRSKFDFLCRYLRAEQVLTLILSDERMPNQCQLFHRYFPDFHQKFSRLRIMKYLNTSTILPQLPLCVSSLSIKLLYKLDHTDHLIKNLLDRHAPYLTHLEVEGSYVFQSIRNSFSRLNHLTVDYCTIGQFDRLRPHLSSSLTRLKLFLDREDPLPILNFAHLSTSMVHLTLIFSQEICMTLQLMTKCLQSLSNLRYLTVQATGTLDLMDGYLWEKYLSQTQIETFRFKFTLASQLTCDQDQISLLESFRSPFWLTKHQWYVACEKGQFPSSRPSIYSIPYFQSTLVFYPTKLFQPISTIDEDPLIGKSINLIVTSHRHIPLPSKPFQHVYTLTFLTSTLPSVEILRSIVYFDHIQELDLSSIKSISIHDLQSLLEQMTNLKHLQMQYDPQFLPPLQIDSYTFSHSDDQLFVLDASNIERFCYLFFHLKYLEISVHSERNILDLLNRLHYLEMIVISCYQDSLIDIGYSWFLRHVPRLKKLHFSYRVTANYLLLVIGDRKFLSNSIGVDDINDCSQTKSSCYQFRSRCSLQ